MRFRFLHAADLHLDSPLRGLERYEGAPVERIRGATRRAFENLVETCLEEQIPLLLIAGDLFDGDWQDYSTGLYFSSRLARLAEAGVQVVWVRGNHDAASRIRKSLRPPGGVRELDSRRPETLELAHLGAVVHGQSYASEDVREDLSAGYPRPVPGAFNIGLLHTALNGRSGHEPYAPCRLEALIDRGYDYWALGHVHRREVVASEPYVVFSGNLQGRHARETGAKGASLVSVEDGRVVRVEPRAFDVVRWETLEIDASLARHPDDVVDRARAELFRLGRVAEGRLLAVRVSVVGESAVHASLSRRTEKLVNEIRAAAAELGEAEVWVEKVRVLTRPELDLDALRGRHDALGEVANALFRLGSNPEELRALASELDELREKLPVELREGPDAIELEGTEALALLVADVERWLIGRLASIGEAEEPP